MGSDLESSPVAVDRPTLSTMRRYSVTEAPKAVLLDTIAAHIKHDEHDGPEKAGRAEAYRRAHRALELDATEVQVRHMHYRIAEGAAKPYGVNEGSREEIVAELEQYRSDRQQQGKSAKANAIGIALAALAADAVVVRIEGQLYCVVEQ